MSNAIERLVFCSKIEAFKNAIEILFINSQKIPRLKAGFWKDYYFLIDVSGDNVAGRRSMETGIRQWKDVLEEYRNESGQIDEEGIKERAKEIVDSLFGKIDLTFEELSRYPWLQHPIQKKGIVSILMKKSLFEYERESELLKRLMNKTNFIDLLSDKDLHLIEPWAQIGICHICKIYEHISTTHGLRPKTCPQCNQQNLTITIYGFDEEFQKHFINNKALQLFCSAYINDIVGKQIANTQKINDEEGKIRGDIDVYIPQTKTGIECKLSIEHEPSDNQFQNHYDEIQKDLKNYVSYGIKNLIVITNIEEHRVNVLKKKLLEDLNLDSETRLRIIHRSVPLLLETLSKEAESIKEYL